jgi:hypothetical protein
MKRFSTDIPGRIYERADLARMGATGHSRRLPGSLLI